MFLSALITVLVGGVFVVQAGAQEPTENESVPQVEEVDPASMPNVDSFGDIVMRVRERFELLAAQTDEKRIELEEKFAARRTAQLEKLESLPDDHPKKQELINRLEARHAELLTNIQERADKLSTVREDILERLEERQAQFEARKARVEERKAAREEKTEDLKLRVEEKREEIKTRLEEKKTLFEEKKQSRVEKAQEASKSGKEKIEAREAKVREAKQLKETKAREAFEKRVGGETPLKLEDTGVVQGAIDYQPSNLLEQIGFFLQGL